MERLTDYVLGDLFEFSNGLNADRGSFGSGIPFANTLEVIQNQAITSQIMPGKINISSETLKRYSLRFGDVLFNRTSETADEAGLASVYLDHAPAVFGGFIFRARPKNSLLDPAYAKYALRSFETRKQIASLGQGGIRSNISQRDLKKVRISLPPVQVQRTTAENLGAVDNLISQLERLIAKKQSIKQGMMQHLLTGKTRLPGFAAPWSNVSAGDVGIFKGGSGFPLKHQGLTSGDYPFFKVSDMNNEGNGLFMRAANHYITESQRKIMGAVMIPKGSIVFAKVGAAVFLERKRILGQLSCIDNNMAAYLLDPTKADVRFVHFALTNFAMSSLVATTAMPSLNGSQLRSIPLLLPSDLGEQKAIAHVLSDSANELELLEMQLLKARGIKQGMMHELLTGRTRLADGGGNGMVSKLESNFGGNES